jgi:hypothetical protein
LASSAVQSLLSLVHCLGIPCTCASRHAPAVHALLFDVCLMLSSVMLCFVLSSLSAALRAARCALRRAWSLPSCAVHAHARPAMLLHTHNHTQSVFCHQSVFCLSEFRLHCSHAVRSSLSLATACASHAPARAAKLLHSQPPHHWLIPLMPSTAAVVFVALWVVCECAVQPRQ